MKKMLDSIKKSLKAIAPDQAEAIFEANFNQKELKGYSAGKILTFGELKKLKDGTVIHLKYNDEDGSLREKGFHKLNKQSKDEWCAGNEYPFPISKLKNNQLLENCDNCGWTFTIREATLKKKK